MELIRISESKLKVMLTSEDMRQYELNAADLDCEDSETRQAFRCILEKAKNQTGFDTHNYRIFIQAYPCRGGGCELYVTKLEKRPPDTCIQKDCFSETDTANDAPDAEGLRGAARREKEEYPFSMTEEEYQSGAGRPTWVDSDFERDCGAQSRNGTERKKKKEKDPSEKTTADKKTILQGGKEKKQDAHSVFGRSGDGGTAGSREESARPDGAIFRRGTRPRYYQFSSLENLLCGCRAMAARGYARESSIFYHEERQIWFLLLRETQGHGPLGEFAFLWEFGRAFGNTDPESYIREHCRPLCEGKAIEIFSAL